MNAADHQVEQQHRLEADLTVTHRLHGVDNTNDMDWSPDGRTMYYIDSLTRQVTAYDYDAAGGAISRPRPIVTLPEGTGVPDGMTVSVDGTLWVAHWGGARVTRWHPDSGALLQTIAVPANLTTSCAFAGPALDKLYITTARYRESAVALAAQPFAGGLFRYRWNRIDHRLFSYIAMNWRGKPLVSLATVVSLIGATTTASGLRVRSEIDTRSYPQGVTVTDHQMQSINLSRHEFHGDWNYTIRPTAPQ